MQFFKQETEWFGHRINQNGIRPLQDELEVITKIENTKQRKRTKIVSGSNSKSIEIYRKPISTFRYSQKTAKKQNEWNWTPEHTEAFKNSKK